MKQTIFLFLWGLSVIFWREGSLDAQESQPSPPIRVALSFSGDETIEPEILKWYHDAFQLVGNLQWVHRPSDAQWALYFNAVLVRPSKKRDSKIAWGLLLFQIKKDQEGNIQMLYERDTLRIVSLQAIQEEAELTVRWLDKIIKSAQ